MAKKSREPLSSVDLAWLRMDNPTNLMIITGLMTFDSKMDFERFKVTVEQRLLRFNRFRQRVVFPKRRTLRPYWKFDPTFNLDEHIQQVSLPPPSDQSALEDLISQLMSQPLDHSRPLWQFYVVDDYQGGSVLVCRLHHCIADGIALMHVLLSMTTNAPNAPLPELPVGAEQDRPGKTGLIPVALLENAAKALSDPAVARQYAHLGLDTAKAAGRLVLRWPDPITIFKGPLAIEKRVTWSAPYALEQVKRIGRAFGGTVNDILLTAVAGALGRYLTERQENADGLSIRGVIPVNLRPLEIDDRLGNKFGLVFLSLPVGVEDPVKRLHMLKQNMDKLKDSPEAVAAFGILGLLGSVPPSLQDIGVSIFDTKGTAVMTNVPGPQKQLYLAGAPMNAVMAWVPQSGRIGLGVSIISYNHKVFLGFGTDKGLIPDPERILDFFAAEFKAMSDMAEARLAKRRESVLPMIADLDKALETLDSLITNAKEIPHTSQQHQPGRCQAITKSGSQCKKPAVPGESYCRIHG